MGQSGLATHLKNRVECKRTTRNSILRYWCTRQEDCIHLGAYAQISLGRRIAAACARLLLGEGTLPVGEEPRRREVDAYHLLREAAARSAAAEAAAAVPPGRVLPVLRSGVKAINFGDPRPPSPI